MAMVQWLGFPALGLCFLLQGCAVWSSDLQYHLALDTDSDVHKPSIVRHK
jgi:hypothetical protein